MIANYVETEALRKAVRLHQKELNRLTWERDRARKERTEARKQIKRLANANRRMYSQLMQYYGCPY